LLTNQEKTEALVRPQYKALQETPSNRTSSNLNTNKFLGRFAGNCRYRF